jgi:hypothetical protein
MVASVLPFRWWTVALAVIVAQPGCLFLTVLGRTDRGFVVSSTIAGAYTPKPDLRNQICDTV